MMPECTFTVHADCRVRIIPLIRGILKTPSLYRIDFFIILNMNSLLQTKHYSLLGLNYYVYIRHFFWKGMLKKQPCSDHFYYVSSDTMHNITHNVHSSITQYTMCNLYRTCISTSLFTPCTHSPDHQIFEKNSVYAISIHYYVIHQFIFFVHTDLVIYSNFS